MTISARNHEDAKRATAAAPVHVAWAMLCAAACSSSRISSSADDIVSPTCTTIAASGDATISTSQLQANFGSNRTLLAGDGNDSLLAFDLSAIPPGATITSASLHVYIVDGGDQPIQVHGATAPWAESTVTFASFANQLAPQVTAMVDVHRANAGKAVDVTKLVGRWVSGAVANDGVVLTGAGHHQATFVSREGGVAEQRPALEVCYTPVDHCASNPCQNGGTCDSTATGFTCACAPGYTGDTCATRVDACAGQPCMNGGACTDTATGYTCACPAGYTGASCETNIDDCASAPCQNGGVCTDGVDSFTCTCAAGYTGATCATLIEHCAGSPCQNAGTCTNSPDGYTCACAIGYTGTNCEVNVDDCVGDPCHNGGTCVDGVATFSCVCAPQWGGATCDVNLDTCSAAPCLNGGTCTNGFGSYSCACAAGYTGANCEIDIDDCASHPCVNGGVCVDGVNSFTCTCPAGFTGTSCEINIDDCAGNPCQNGGRCIDGIASHTCACPLGFTGADCQTAQVEIRGTLRTFSGGLPEALGTVSAVLGWEDYPISYAGGGAALWTDARTTGVPYKLVLDESSPGTFVFDSPAFAPTGTTDAFSVELHTSLTYVPGSHLVVSAAEPIAVYLNGDEVSSYILANLDTWLSSSLPANAQFSLDIYYTHEAGPGTPIHIEVTRPTCSVKTHSGYDTVPMASVATLGNAAVGAIVYDGQLATSPATTETAIRLIPDTTPANTSGAAWWSQPIATGRAFRVEYDVSSQGTYLGRNEGYALVMAPSAYRGGAGSDLGYAGAASIAIEFDFHPDAVNGDPSAAASVAVHSAGAAPNSASEMSGALLGTGLQPTGGPIDTSVHWNHMIIEYEPGNGSGYGWLRVYTDDNGTFTEYPNRDPSFAILQAQISDSLVSAALGSHFFIGFTSSSAVSGSDVIVAETDILHVRIAQPDCASCNLLSAQTSSITSSPSSVLASQQGSFVVQSADTVGRPFRAGGGAACFAAAIADGTDVQPATVTDNDDGSYTVSYRPDQPGTWLGFVRLGGLDIAGSPVVFTAQ